MQAEILITGNEILSGKTVDSNSSFIAKSLASIGIQVIRNQTVGDDVNKIASVIKELSNRAPLVILTGGLGPTQDDLTAEAAAKASNDTLVLFEDALKDIQSYFKKHQKPMPKSNEKQALLPKNSFWFKNEMGTAPGFALTYNCCFFVFLPGVPKEMQYMLENHVIPLLKEKFKDTLLSIHEKILSAFGMPEAEIGEKLRDIPALFPDVVLNTCPEIFRIQIILSVQGQRAEQLNKAVNEVKNRLGDVIFSEKNQTMEEVVGELLIKKNATLSIAESCTGGLIASKITDVPGSSSYFNCSIVSYSNEMKNAVLQVSNVTLEKFGAVSEETVKEMAVGVQKIANTTYALSISGIAGPDGGSEEKPVGTVKIGLVIPGGVKLFNLYFSSGNRASKKMVFATAALDILRRELLNLHQK